MAYRTSPADPPAQWACSDCGCRSSVSGACPRCGEGPLLDLEDPNVVEALVAHDRERADAKRRWKIAVALPFGLVTACVTMFIPCHYRMWDVPVMAAPLAGLVVSVIVLAALGRFARPRQLWAPLAPPLRDMRVKGLRTGVFVELGVGVLLVAAVVSLALGLVVSVDSIAHRENVARGKQLDVVRARWSGLRKCLVARSNTPPLQVWNEERPPSQGNCDRETHALYVEAQKYPDLRIVTALEEIAQCKRRCEMPALDNDRAFVLRRASYFFDYNPNYISSESQF